MAHKKTTSCAKYVEPKNLGSFCTIPNGNRKTAFKKLPTLEEGRQEAQYIEERHTSEHKILCTQ
jgi:hypothetical protein